jgi:hypothetical protein
MNFPAITRRIRQCESDVAAQLVLEYAILEYAIAEAVTAERGHAEERKNAMTREEENFILKQAKLHDVRFVRCNGVLYEIRHLSFATGPSPVMIAREITPINIEFRPDPYYYGDAPEEAMK